MTEEDTSNWTLDKLRRKANQQWELAGLARQARDHADEAKHMALARKYDEEIKSRNR